ncbi:autophagy-related protein 9-like isoform X2 [Zingiber officinale]|uniref:autophagy-related protein 9-like isoform X2 n=1 Tax=Zingiber officinale TaxID=94328 RepID=UPI001C4D298F|nr:autophagy-related protein 9-like isoform X2 [Zingiber officinale]
MSSWGVLRRFKWPWKNRRFLNSQVLDDRAIDIELTYYTKLPAAEPDSPSDLLTGEEQDNELIVDLDIFFESLYNYYCGKGLKCITIKWIVEILTVIFMEFFIWFFLLVVDWPALHTAKCGIDALKSRYKTCDLAEIAIKKHPLVPFTLTKGVIVGCMVMLAIYGVFNFLIFIVQFKGMLKVRNFYYNSLNITDREIQAASWQTVLEKIIQSQHTQRLCVVKKLSAHDIVMRMMRKENYLIAMLNKGVLAFPVPWLVPGAGPSLIKNGRKYQIILPKTLEWILNWCIFQSMFDSKFCVQREFVENTSLLRMRIRIIGIVMFLISPCLAIFMLVYLFLRHAEQFYHHPSTASSRRWSNLSKWIFREFNEVEHLFRYRMNNSIAYASNYLKQFPAPCVSLIAKFISFVSGGFAAILIIIAFMDESLLEGHVFGRNLFWYAAIFGSATAISRAAISDEVQVLDHDGAMSLVVNYTHYMPKRWRGKEKTDLVRAEFQSMFQYTGTMLLEELLSIFLTPIILVFFLPERVDDILHFILEHTVYVEGVGDVCSTFNFKNHGNTKYGSPCPAEKERSSSQGKMEKSFFSFQCAYLYSEPDADGQQFLSTLQKFKEKQTHLARVSDLLQTWKWQPTRGLSSQPDIVHRFTPNMLSSNRCFLKNGCHLDSPFAMDRELLDHPYILDCYHASKPLEVLENQEGLPSPRTEVAFKPNQDFIASQNNLRDEVENKDQHWDLSFSDQLLSRAEASTSGSLFQSSPAQDGMHHSRTMARWWERRASSLATGTSFLEPPTRFHNHNYSHHSDDVLKYGDDIEDLGEHQASSSIRDDSGLDDEVLDLAFVDNDDQMKKNMKLRLGGMI